MKSGIFASVALECSNELGQDTLLFEHPEQISIATTSLEYFQERHVDLPTCKPLLDWGSCQFASVKLLPLILVEKLLLTEVTSWNLQQKRKIRSCCLNSHQWHQDGVQWNSLQTLATCIEAEKRKTFDVHKSDNTVLLVAAAIEDNHGSCRDPVLLLVQLVLQQPNHLIGYNYTRSLRNWPWGADMTSPPVSSR